MNTFDIAEKAANIEVAFEDICNKYNGDLNLTHLCYAGGKTYEILDVFEFSNDKLGTQYPKGVVLRDEDGNVFFHFNGTGDANWGYNAAAYGGPPSDMQQQALAEFDRIVGKLKEKGEIKGNLYVTGHSQGGNNAMFVTMRSQYADDISACVPLDGPGFSEQFVNDTINDCGREEYDKRRDKIYAYNGENDYVSCLGETSVVPDGHTHYIKYAGSGFDFTLFHDARGLLDDKWDIYGKMKEVPEDSDFRKFINSAISKVNNIEPPERKLAAAEALMKLCENYLEGDHPHGKNSAAAKDDFTEADMELLRHVLAELIVDIMADDPDKLAPMLRQFGMDEGAIAALVAAIRAFGVFSEEDREYMVYKVLSLLKVENNRITVDLSAIGDILLVEGYTIISKLIDTAIHDPERIVDTIKDILTDPVVIKWIVTHPTEFVVGCIITMTAIAVVAPIAITIIFVADIISSLLDILGIDSNEFWKGVIDFLVAFVAALAAIADWVKRHFSAAYKYVQNNPSYRVNTDKLREYSNRLANVNSRLKRLDNALNSLYWDVGLDDILTLLNANLLMCESGTLNKVRDYLDKAADRFERVDNNVVKYMEG